MLREITKGQLLAWRLGQLKDQGTLIHEQVSLAKMNNVDIALQVAELHGTFMAQAVSSMSTLS